MAISIAAAQQARIEEFAPQVEGILAAMDKQPATLSASFDVTVPGVRPWPGVRDAIIAGIEKGGVYTACDPKSSAGGRIKVTRKDVESVLVALTDAVDAKIDERIRIEPFGNGWMVPLPADVYEEQELLERLREALLKLHPRLHNRTLPAPG